jgi:hypothetical protein
MSLLSNTSANFNSSSSKRSYITSAAFNSIIYSYTTTLNTTNFKQEGRLAVLTTLPSGATITAANCPAGRILREVGRKLFPGANPGLVLGDSYQGTPVTNNNLNKMWVLVFDSVTGLRGYIDPNAPQFAVYNSDRNPAFVDVAETVGGTPTRLGQPVNTAGDVVLGGKLTLTNVVTSTANPVVGGSAVVGTLTLAGATPVVVNTTAVATTSKIFLSRNTNGGTPANFAISAQTANSFSVTGTAGDTSTVNWLVVNTA